ncbi:hypothetical protein [Brevibacterium permense]|nr:hypothetical protein [Brevibacterium permense]
MRHPIAEAAPKFAGADAARRSAPPRTCPSGRVPTDRTAKKVK